MKIIWHGEPCPQEHLARVEAELAGMLGGMLDSPQQLISHSIFLGNGAAVTAWGETGDDAFHAEYHVSTRERADKALFDRIQQLYEPCRINVEGDSRMQKKKKAKAKTTPAKKAKKTPPTPPPDETWTYNPDSGYTNLMLEAILDCYRQLSPEHLDGDAAHIRRTIAEAERKLRRLFAEYGREVGQDEIFWWEEQKNKYQHERSQQGRTHKGKRTAVRRDNESG